MGKSALAFNIAENVARQTDQTVLVFSMEMSSEQIVRRFISSIANIGSAEIITRSNARHRLGRYRQSTNNFK